MPADYMSTARALSLSSSPSEPNDIRPPWRQSPDSRRHTTRPPRDAVSFRDQILNRASRTSHRIARTWGKMNFWQKVGAVVAVIAAMALGLAFMIFTGQVFVWLAPVAEKWEKSKLAFFVLWLCVFFVSFPPLVGWSTFGTVSGYIFGVWKGWLLYTTATILGSTCSFIVSRTILSKFVHRLMERDTRFAALSLTLKYDGLKLLCMIRLCPLPYSICNGAVSTFPTVQPLMYGLATAIISPKLLVPAFIGSRIRLLSDENESMSPGSKAVNIASIIVSVGIGVFTGWYIYKRTLARAKELEAREREDMRTDVTDAVTTPGDEEERIGFDEEEDNIDLAVDDSDPEDPMKSRTEGQYHDEFTDNDSDVFRDGDGTDSEAYGLHRHIGRSGSQR